jgi:hypothetical protein
MKVFKKLIVFLITAALLLTIAVASYAQVINYIFNGSFEQLIDGSPANWVTHSYDKSSDAAVFKVETDNPQLGEKYATITNNVPNDSRYIQTVLVEENKKYKLSCYIKTENVSEEGNGANLSIAGQQVTSKKIKGTTDDWEYVELYTVIESGVETMKVTVGVGGYGALSTGKASFDNVLMEEVETIPEGAPCAIIKPTENESKDNKDNNSDNSSNNSSSKKDESKTELGKVVWVVLILAAIVVGVAVFNTYKSANNPSGNSGNASNKIDSNKSSDIKDDNDN